MSELVFKLHANAEARLKEILRMLAVVNKEAMKEVPAGTPLYKT